MAVRFLDPANVSRAFRDPVTWAALAIDLIPIYAVLMFGWGAAPLVFLYWLENLVIGLVTLARIIASGLGSGAGGIGAILIMVPFFTVHYGLFCFGHGMFLSALSMGSMNALESGNVFVGYGDLIRHALSSGLYMPTFILLIIGFNIFLFAIDFIGKGEFLHSDPTKEMFAPYGRIVVLHVALFVGMFALISFGEPMLGVLALIMLRVVWGIIQSVYRRVRLDQKVDAAS